MSLLPLDEIVLQRDTRHYTFGRVQQSLIIELQIAMMQFGKKWLCLVLISTTDYAVVNPMKKLGP